MIAIFVAGMVIGAALLALALHFNNKVKPTKVQDHAHVPSAIGLGGNASAEAVNNEWQQRCFHEMSKNTFFELRY